MFNYSIEAFSMNVDNIGIQKYQVPLVITCMFLIYYFGYLYLYNHFLIGKTFTWTKGIIHLKTLFYPIPSL